MSYMDDEQYKERWGIDRLMWKYGPWEPPTSPYPSQEPDPKPVLPQSTLTIKTSPANLEAFQYAHATEEGPSHAHESELEIKEYELNLKEGELNAREVELNTKEEELNTMEADLKLQDDEMWVIMDRLEAEADESRLREQGSYELEKKVDAEYDAMRVRVKAIDEREARFKAKVTAKTEELDERRTALDAREANFDANRKEFEVQRKLLESALVSVQTVNQTLIDAEVERFRTEDMDYTHEDSRKAGKMRCSATALNGS